MHQQHACAQSAHSTYPCVTQAPLAATTVSAVAAVAAHEDMRWAAAVVVLLQVLQRESSAAPEAVLSDCIPSMMGPQVIMGSLAYCRIPSHGTWTATPMSYCSTSAAS